jgi:uncharacterized protein (TIGR03067 family)
MRSLHLLIAALLVVPLLGSDSPKEYDDATAKDELQGTWHLVGYERHGQLIEISPGGIQTFRGGQWVYHQLGTKSSYGGSYKADPNQTPRLLDETKTTAPDYGETTKFIYQLDGDKLRTARRLSPPGRPQSFEEDDIYVVVWKRVAR